MKKALLLWMFGIGLIMVNSIHATYLLSYRLAKFHYADVVERMAGINTMRWKEVWPMPNEITTLISFHVLSLLIGLALTIYSILRAREVGRQEWLIRK